MNRYGLDNDYYVKQLAILVQNLSNYKPTELHRALTVLAESVRPIDRCNECKKMSLVVFDDDSNECLKCQNIQNVLGT